MGKGLHEQYSYCRNISHISAFLWGYVLIWYACGDSSAATKRNLVEILRFRHFSRHVVFDAEGDKFRNKRTLDDITVSVVIDIGCGDCSALEIFGGIV